MVERGRGRPIHGWWTNIYVPYHPTRRRNKEEREKKYAWLLGDQSNTNALVNCSSCLTCEFKGAQTISSFILVFLLSFFFLLSSSTTWTPLWAKDTPQVSFSPHHHHHHPLLLPIYLPPPLPPSLPSSPPNQEPPHTHTKDNESSLSLSSSWNHPVCGHCSCYEKRGLEGSCVHVFYIGYLRLSSCVAVVGTLGALRSPQRYDVSN